MSALDDLRRRVGGDADAGLAGFSTARVNGVTDRYPLAAAAGRVVARHEPPIWHDPLPLPAPLPAVDPFDDDLLPNELRPWVTDIAERMQCPPDFLAVGALVALSSLVGARAALLPKAQDDEWLVPPNLWGMVIGRPGVMKSPALSEVLKPLKRLDAAERELWAAEHEAWALDTRLAELADKQREKDAAGLALKDPAKARALLEAQPMPEEPKQRRYIVTDTTVQKLTELLVTNPWGLLAYSDELLGLITSMDAPGQEGARAFYLQAYDGTQGWAVDRVIRGSSFIPRVCLSLLGGIQPSKVQSYVRDAVRGGVGDDGLLQRFGLTVWPDVDQVFVNVDRAPDRQARERAHAVFDRLNELQPATDTDPVIWRFSPEAQSTFVEWRLPFETELRGDELHPALVSHLTKFRKLVPALALLFALVDTPDSGEVVHEAELLRALRWADYLRSHAERLYTAAVLPESSGAHALLAKMRAGKVADGFTPREVAQKGWSGLTAPEDVRKAAELLVEHRWLHRREIESGPLGGRPSERYLLHPQLPREGVA